MSGGVLFDFRWPNLGEADSKWHDEEMNELYHDLFVGGEFSVRGYDGLAQSLDFWLSDDTDEEHYRKQLARFKAKWFHRTPKNRIEYYEGKIQEYADRCKAELGLLAEREGEEGR